MSQSARIEVAGDSTSLAWDPASSAGPRTVVVCAHGAGGHMADRGLVQVSQTLRDCGLDTVRFNFLYREKGSGRPDPMPRLMQCFTAVVDWVRREIDPAILVIGGRSMGGRAGSMLAADGFACDGLLLLAYPLHPAGRPGQLRAAHLPRILAPVLCFNGTRDKLCRQDLMERVLADVGPNWRMHWLVGADHSLHVLKSSGTTDTAVLDTVGAATRAWVTGLDSA